MNIIELNTSCDGAWCNVDVPKKVRILKFIFVPNYDKTFWYELQVVFDTNSWEVTEDGLIYGDGLFEEELKNLMENLGFEPDIYYSEQGMQGNNFVSFDMGQHFKFPKGINPSLSEDFFSYSLEGELHKLQIDLTEEAIQHIITIITAKAFRPEYVESIVDEIMNENKGDIIRAVGEIVLNDIITYAITVAPKESGEK